MRLKIGHNRYIHVYVMNSKYQTQCTIICVVKGTLKYLLVEYRQMEVARKVISFSDLYFKRDTKNRNFFINYLYLSEDTIILIS